MIYFLLLYWNIQTFTSISISEHEKWADFLSKTGFHVRNFSAPCFGFVTSLKYDTISDHKKKTHCEQGKVIKYFVLLVRSLSLFSTTLIAKLTYLKALGIESDYDIPNNWTHLSESIGISLAAGLKCGPANDIIRCLI